MCWNDAVKRTQITIRDYKLSLVFSVCSYRMTHMYFIIIVTHVLYFELLPVVSPQCKSQYEGPDRCITAAMKVFFNVRANAMNASPPVPHLLPLRQTSQSTPGCRRIIHGRHTLGWDFTSCWSIEWLARCISATVAVRPISSPNRL